MFVYMTQPVVNAVVLCIYKHSTGCETRLTTGLTAGCIVYTAGCQTGCQPVVQPGLTARCIV